MPSELKPCPFCGGKPHSNFNDMKAVIICEDCNVELKTSLQLLSLRIVKDTQERTARRLWNTRAVPDVPELVRYTYDTWPVSWCLDNVEMVNADQADAVIAAKDAEIDTGRKANDHLSRMVIEADQRAETAEAKLAQSEERIADLLKEVESLSVIVASGINDVAGASLDDLEAEVSELKSKPAQIEKQEPVASRHKVSIFGEETDWRDGDGKGCYPKEAFVIVQSLYTAPVASDADLRAERETITGYVSSNDKSVISKGGGWCILVHARQTEIYSNPVTVAALNPSEPQT